MTSFKVMPLSFLSYVSGFILSCLGLDGSNFYYLSSTFFFFFLSSAIKISVHKVDHPPYRLV